MNPERSIIGACLVDPEAIYIAGEILQETDFTDRDMRKLWATMSNMASHGEALDIITVSDQGWNIGDLGELAHDAPASRNIRDWAKLVARNSARVQAIALLKNSLDELQNGDVGETVAHTMASLQMLGETDNDRLMTVADAMQDLRAEQTKSQELIKRFGCPGIPTGIKAVQAMLGGWRPEFVIVAARPSIGKTSAMHRSAVRAAEMGVRAGYFTAEMRSYQLVGREYARRMQVPYGDILRGEMATIERIERLPECRAVADLPIIYDETSLDLGKVLARIAAMVSKGVEIIFYDHIGWMKDASERERIAQLSNIGKALKLAVKRHGIPIIGLYQLNRDSAKEGRAPEMHDLRGSGTLEEDGETIILMHCPNPEDEIREVYWNFVKSRNGKRGKSMPTEFNARTQEWN